MVYRRPHLPGFTCREVEGCGKKFNKTMSRRVLEIDYWKMQQWRKTTSRENVNSLGEKYGATKAVATKREPLKVKNESVIMVNRIPMKKRATRVERKGNEGSSKKQGKTLTTLIN